MVFKLTYHMMKGHIKTFGRYLFLPKDVTFIDDFDGEEYSYSTPRRTRLIGQLAGKIQWLLWKCNIHWHNPIRNECTPDFSCCRDKTDL